MDKKILRWAWFIGLAAIVAVALTQLLSGEPEVSGRNPAPTKAPSQVFAPAKQLGEPKEKRPLAEASANDPLLSRFAGISWGMTREELTEKFGPGLVRDSSGMIFRENNLIYGTMTWMLSIRDNGLSMIVVSVSAEDKLSMLQLMFRARYGDAIQSSYTRALIGKPEVDPNGDTLAWQSADTVVCMHHGSVIYVPYSPGPLIPETVS